MVWELFLDIEEEGRIMFTIWLTGLPCSGKTTIAKGLEKHLDIVRIDGDIIRKSLNKDLGFSLKDREENIRRVANICKMLNDSGKNVIASFVSPTDKIRTLARDIIRPHKFILVFVKAKISTCEERDTKGMWKKARAGLIKEFTGVDSPYNVPRYPNITLDTDLETEEESVKELLRFLYIDGIVKPQRTMFIGRYSPPSIAHKYLFDTVLDNGGWVVIAIRDTKESSSNPIPVKKRIELWKKIYKDNPKVVVIEIPDIDEVCVGRKVGYKILAVPENIRQVSATNIRKGKYDDIPEEIREEVKRLLDENKKVSS